jgi:uncharacterized protein (TIGR02646 family)
LEGVGVVIVLKPPPAPEKLSALARDEVDRLRAKLKRGEELTSKDFKAYKTPGVRDALSACFRSKCAYCESIAGATQPVAIEHYRPKAKVKTREGVRQGYYWSAGAWLNLLPSCTDCNSERKHTIAGKVVTVGKGNQFPIGNESCRAQCEEEEKAERRLLLHPYRDKPDKHLEFGEDGIVRPRRLGQRDSRKGASSITVYALQRPILVDARRGWQGLIRAQMNVVEREARRVDADPANAEQGRILDQEIAMLSSYCDGDRPYTQMARQMIEPFMEGLLE